MRAWVRWCCCCGACADCCEGRGGGGGGDAKGLLPSNASHDDVSLKETTYYSYDVRRISSFPPWQRSTWRVRRQRPPREATVTASKALLLIAAERLSLYKKSHPTQGFVNKQDVPALRYQTLREDLEEKNGFGRSDSKETLPKGEAEAVVVGRYTTLGDGDGDSVTAWCGSRLAPSPASLVPSAWASQSSTRSSNAARNTSPTPTWTSGGADSLGVVAQTRAAGFACVDESGYALRRAISAPELVVACSSRSSTMTGLTSATFTIGAPSCSTLASGLTYTISPSLNPPGSSPRPLPKDFIASGDGSGGGGGAVDEGGGGAAAASVNVKQQAPWRAVLRRLRPLPSRTRSPRLGSGGSASDGGRLHPLARLAPDLALSTPNLAKSPKVVASGPRSTLTLGFPSRIRGASSTCLPRDLVAEQETVTTEMPDSMTRYHASNTDRKEHWSRTHSMESMDVDEEPSSPFPDEVFEGANSINLAQSVGLDMRLYSVDHCASYSSSTPGTTVSSSISDNPVIKAKSFDEDKRMFEPDNASFLSSSGFLASQESFVDQAFGTITFAASYYQKNKKLCIELEKLDDLPPKGRNSVYDIIVRLSILPAEKQIKSTQILRGSLSPMIREDFNFGMKDPIGKIMRFSVYNSMYQGKHDAIGHACFNVEDVINGKPRKYSMKLTRQSQPGSSCGLLQVYLQLSQEQRLIIDTIQARNLCVSPVLRSNRSSEIFSTYIKITFYNAGQKVKSKKSSVVTSDRNPQYEFSSDFKVVTNQLDNCYIVLSVVLKASLRKDVTLGRYILGPHYFSERREITPWGRAILQHEQICHWFHLYL